MYSICSTHCTDCRLTSRLSIRLLHSLKCCYTDTVATVTLLGDRLAGEVAEQQARNVYSEQRNTTDNIPVSGKGGPYATHDLNKVHSADNGFGLTFVECINDTKSFHYSGTCQKSRRVGNAKFDFQLMHTRTSDTK